MDCTVLLDIRQQGGALAWRFVFCSKILISATPCFIGPYGVGWRTVALVPGSVNTARFITPSDTARRVEPKGRCYIEGGARPAQARPACFSLGRSMAAVVLQVADRFLFAIANDLVDSICNLGYLNRRVETRARFCESSCRLRVIIATCHGRERFGEPLLIRR